MNGQVGRFDAGDVLLQCGRVFPGMVLSSKTFGTLNAERSNAVLYRCHLAVYLAVIAVSIATQSLAAVWLWVLPVRVGQFFIRPYLWVEHTGCAHSGDMLPNTRTTHTHAFVRFFAWNMPHPVEHHASPAVPFHALPKPHTLLAPHMLHSARGYPGRRARWCGT